jgi:2-furoate---CoA ligase
VPVHGLHTDRRCDPRLHQSISRREIDLNLALSLLYAAERTPAAEALVGPGTRHTYAELCARAARIATALAQRGVQRGDRVACVLRNDPATVELYWGCQWLGACFVPLSHRVSREDLDYCIADCGAGVVLRDPSEVRELDGEEHPGALDLDERETSIQLYTSGTTGRPKGVPRSHRAERAGGLSQVLQHGLAFGDRTLGVMPLYHTMGIHSLIAVSLVGGCFVAQPSWDAEQALRLIEEEQITSLYLAPTLYYDLVHHPRFGELDTSSVRAVAYAGAPMTSALAEKVAEALDPEVFVNHYGSTEIYTFSVHRDQRAKPGCAGRPALNASLRLEPPGEGEILCHMSSDEAFAGYWNRPDADEKAIRDGWYHTGDVGRIDDDGDLWVVGRVDDMIISGGENIHPVEVEDVLARAPGVREVAVVAAPDDRWGQRVVACVVADEGVTAEALDAYCLESDRLARFKRPREYRFVSELPKSPSGKILRRMLREATPAERGNG